MCTFKKQSPSLNHFTMKRFGNQGTNQSGKKLAAYVQHNWQKKLYCVPWQNEKSAVDALFLHQEIQIK